MVVDREPLLRLSGTWTELHTCLAEEASELTRVFQKLQTLSGMEEVCESLRRTQKELDETAWSAYQGARTLEQAVRTYESCERRIQGEYEDTAVRYTRLESGVVDLSHIQNLLRGY